MRLRSGRYVRDGSYDYSGSADVQEATVDGAPASSPKEDPNESEAAKVRC